MFWYQRVVHKFPTNQNELNLWTFQGPSLDQISYYKDFNGKFHHPDVLEIYHIYVVTYHVLALRKPCLTKLDNFSYLEEIGKAWMLV